jgi:hypothetical protein
MHDMVGHPKEHAIVVTRFAKRKGVTQNEAIRRLVARVFGGNARCGCFAW